VLAGALSPILNALRANIIYITSSYCRYRTYLQNLIKIEEVSHFSLSMLFFFFFCEIKAASSSSSNTF
jgi:hypothetical protein